MAEDKKKKSGRDIAPQARETVRPDPTGGAGVKPRIDAPVVGLALGSGSARGWSPIGVILQLGGVGIRPRVVAGTSIGALVGAVYVSGQLAEFSEWVQKLTVRDVELQDHPDVGP